LDFIHPWLGGWVDEEALPPGWLAAPATANVDPR